MVPDPYRALGLPHEASQIQIKTSYRKLALKYHPDRLTRQNASPQEQEEASNKFAAISAAYSLLSDPQRKAQYDHIYKYGGYDDDPTEHQQSRRQQTYQRSSSSSSSFSPFPTQTKEGRSKGIGYVVKDPISMIFCQQGKAAAVAGIQIPARMHISHPPPGGGVRFFGSSGKIISETNGSKKFVSKTTQFVQGKKYTRVETTTVHPDGRKEVVIEGNDYVERHVSSPPKRRKKKKGQDVTNTEEAPWYIGAWHQMREKLSMCHNPCGTILAQ
jgi:curved DNA-binding protein CbpA